MAIQQMVGTRLAYAVVKQKGKVKREVCSFDPKKGGIIRKTVEEDAGYVVFFPMGHAIRCKDEHELAEVVYQGMPATPDGDLVFCSMDDIHNPNSRIGQMMATQNDEKRHKLANDFVGDVQRLVEHQCGPVVAK